MPTRKELAESAAKIVLEIDPEIIEVRFYGSGARGVEHCPIGYIEKPELLIDSRFIDNLIRDGKVLVSREDVNKGSRSRGNINNIVF